MRIGMGGKGVGIGMRKGMDRTWWAMAVNRTW